MWFVVPEGQLKAVIWSPSKWLSSAVSFIYILNISLVALLGKATALVQAWASLPGYHNHHPILGPGPCTPRSPSLQVFSFLKWREYLRPREAK